MQARDLQFHFAAYVPPRIPGWAEALGRLLARLAPVLKYVFWGGLALGVALLLFLLGRELWRVRFGRIRRKPKVKAEDDWRPEAATARALLHEADVLAGEGRYDEAARLILFRSIEELSGRRPGAVRPALTSRDIAAAQAIPPAARGAFAHIAGVVEHSFFGGRRLGRDEFSDCRQAYERFAFAEGWT